MITIFLTMRKVQKVFEKVYKSSDNITENILYLTFFKSLLQSFGKKKKKTFPKKINLLNIIVNV